MKNRMLASTTPTANPYLLFWQTFILFNILFVYSKSTGYGAGDYTIHIGKQNDMNYHTLKSNQIHCFKQTNVFMLWSIDNKAITFGNLNILAKSNCFS